MFILISYRLLETLLDEAAQYVPFVMNLILPRLMILRLPHIQYLRLIQHFMMEA